MRLAGEGSEVSSSSPATGPASGPGFLVCRRSDLMRLVREDLGRRDVADLRCASTMRRWFAVPRADGMDLRSFDSTSRFP
jgi:hypothetical protein